MATTRTPTEIEGTQAPFAPPAVPVRELYGALMENWRTRDLPQSQYNLERLSDALAAQDALDDAVAARVRALETLLARHAGGAPQDDEIAGELVQLRHAIGEYL